MNYITIIDKTIQLCQEYNHMLPQLIGNYYSSRLEKLGFDLYKLLTYLPFRLEVISPNIKSESGTIFLTGKISNIASKGKFQTFDFVDPNLLYPVTVYDFGKKLAYIKNLNPNNQYQILIIKSTTYYNLQEIAPLSTLSDDYELGSLKRQDYYKPVYTQLSFNLRTKQLNKIYNSIPSHLMILDLTDLVPENSLIPLKLDMAMIHKPKSISQFNEGLRIWNNFQAFLNLVFLNNLNKYEKKSGALLNQYPIGFVDEFQKNLDINLSSSQLTAIEEILSNITVK
jgi:RecG-like helicase